MTNRTFLVAALGASLFLGACGGDDGGDDDVTVQPDANDNTPTPDAPPAAACPISSDDFGAAGALNGMAYFDPGMDAADPADDVLTFAALLEAQAPADAIQIDLYNGYGVFANGIAPGTYTLSGDELDFATCGACVRIFTNVDAQGNSDGFFMPTAGTLTVTEAGAAVGSNLTGTLSNVTFQHVDIDPANSTTTPAADAATCTTSITSASFTGQMQAVPAN